MIFDAQAALLEAIEQSDLRPFQKKRMRIALRFRPVLRAEMLGAVQMHCCMEGLVTEGGEVEAAVDWQAVIDAIVKYLPAILSIIMLFI